MKKEKKILISIIGTGYDLYIAELKPETAASFYCLFQQGKDKVNHLFSDALWIKQKNNKENAAIKLLDFQKIQYYRGADVSSNGQIEFAINGKRIKKYKFEDLRSENRLFPLFYMKEENLIHHSRSNKDVVFGYQEKGQLAKFCIYEDVFNPDLLQLNFIQFLANDRTISLLHELNYNGIKLSSINEDSLITGTILNLM